MKLYSRKDDPLSNAIYRAKSTVYGVASTTELVQIYRRNHGSVCFFRKTCSPHYRYGVLSDDGRLALASYKLT
jgi:hypothetical protein